MMGSMFIANWAGSVTLPCTVMGMFGAKVICWAIGCGAGLIEGGAGGNDRIVMGSPAPGFIERATSPSDLDK